ncbi:hypothetical protein ILUMI_05315 [Ignelater luminosus]|uniref:THAP-type domain-containing protein n=1 Tax=Ignelater luminosus TaxID=2038154 RepID=A0A8K0DI07_IGNLU|nr:hypothetical protein ILUMI_05315 [Ignelater luminosus]
MKKYRCCIPGCNTYGPLSNFLSIPFESQWRDQWLSVIPRKDWVVDSSTVACIKHFQQSSIKQFIPTNNTQNGKKGTTKLHHNILAVPQYFPEFGTPNNSQESYFPVEMFELYCRDSEGPDTTGDIEDDDKDYLLNYGYFKLKYPQRFATFLESIWQVHSTEERTFFYTVDFSERPRVPCSIKVDNDLRVVVSLDGRHVDPCDLTWVLPVTTNKINRWSQLLAMLTMYGK